MKHLLAIAAAAVLGAPGIAAATVDLSAVPPARSVEESKARLNERVRTVVEALARGGVGKFDDGIGFWSPALARLGAGKDVAAVDSVLLDPATIAYGKAGTNFRAIPGLCHREGDYDFMLQALVNLASRHDEAGQGLAPRARWRVAWELLTERGSRHYRTFTLGLCGKHVDTENHILLTESSRYLTNQLLLRDLRKDGRYHADYDNSRNGFDDWMIDHLRAFLVRGFDEYNSKPYQAYHLLPLQNLHDHADSPEVRLAARMVLDYLAGVFAAQSIGLRRMPPYRRQPRFRDNPMILEGDAEAARYAILAGNYEGFSRLEKPFQPPYGAPHMLAAGLSKYRIPDLILDLMVNRERHAYFQTFRHQTPELYFMSRSFLISAGGIYRNRPDFGTKQNDGWAMPTAVIPADGGYDRREYLRFDGHRKESKRKNTCVAPGFACGVNPVIPDSIPPERRETSGPYTFLRFDGFHAAVYSRPCDTRDCRRAAGSFGFLEAAEASRLPYDEFKRAVLEGNRGREFGSEKVNRYRTSDGREISFTPYLRDEGRWEISDINGTRQPVEFRTWPLAWGDVMDAWNDGQVIIKNPARGETLDLDLRSPARLIRREKSNR